MGGRINYQKYKKIEHNIKYDIESAKIVFNSDWNKKYILSDITRNNKLRIAKNCDFYKEIVKSKKPHIGFIKESIDCWFKSMYPESYMHDPLTLFSAFNEEVITFIKKKILLHDNGRIIFDKMGKSTLVSSAANYDLFWSIFKKRILT
jgi:inosine-uridine nucleoside N-ribohydrolase